MNSKEIVVRQYHCPVCKTRHNVELSSVLVKNKTYFPVSYFYLHKFEGETKGNLDLVDADVYTVLYIDKQLQIRGVEAATQDTDGNFISKQDVRKMMDYLTNHITDLQRSYDELALKYEKLKKSIKNSK
ncbi:MAG: hypothetical protein ACTSVU_03790 [Promethearchaeota archaeon]